MNEIRENDSRIRREQQLISRISFEATDSKNSEVHLGIQASHTVQFGLNRPSSDNSVNYNATSRFSAESLSVMETCP